MPDYLCANLLGRNSGNGGSSKRYEDPSHSVLLLSICMQASIHSFDQLSTERKQMCNAILFCYCEEEDGSVLMLMPEAKVL